MVVVIEVKGGVAYVRDKDAGVTVDIVDRDTGCDEPDIETYAPDEVYEDFHRVS